MILVDPKEKQGRIIRWLDDLGVPYKISEQDLIVGDYRINDSIVIELKSAKDYIQSYLNNRLNNQLYDQSSNYRHSFLVIYGDILSELLEGHIETEKFVSSLVRNSLLFSDQGVQGKVSIIMLNNYKEVALFLKHCYKKSLHVTPAEPQPIKYSDNTITKKQATFRSIPEIGKSNDRKFILKYKSLKNLCNTTLDELKSIDGIGKTKAENIFNHINNEDVLLKEV